MPPAALPEPIEAPQANNGPPIATTTETVNGADANGGVNGNGTTQNNAFDAGLVSDGIDQRLSNVVEINGDLWVAETVLDASNTSTANPQGTDAIAWLEIKLTTTNGVVTAASVIQDGLITSKGTSEPNLFFYFPSIAVNASDDVVIGFEGSDATHFISSYTAVGTTNLGVTTFTIPTLLKQGQGVFQGLDLGIEPGAIGPTATPPGPRGRGQAILRSRSIGGVDST